MEFIKSNKGGVNICYEGHQYIKRAQLKDNVIVYECVLRRVQQCKAKIVVKGSEPVRANNTHTHAPDQANIAALLALQKLKSRARESLETP